MNLLGTILEIINNVLQLINNIWDLFKKSPEKAIQVLIWLKKHFLVIAISFVAIILLCCFAYWFHKEQIRKLDVAYHYYWAGQTDRAKDKLRTIWPIPCTRYNHNVIACSYANFCFSEQPPKICIGKLPEKNSVWKNVILAHEFYADGQFDSAIKAYQQLLGQNQFPDHLARVECYLGKARSLYRKATHNKDFLKVKEQLSYVEIIKPNCAMASMLYGLVYMDELKFASAKEQFNKANVIFNKFNYSIVNRMAEINAALIKKAETIENFLKYSPDTLAFYRKQYHAYVNKDNGNNIEQNQKNTLPRWVMLPLKPLKYYSPWINNEYDISTKINDELIAISESKPVSPFLLYEYLYDARTIAPRFLISDEINKMAEIFDNVITGTIKQTDDAMIVIEMALYRKQLTTIDIIPITPVTMHMHSNIQRAAEECARNLHSILQQ